ncbi:uncharacterized protein PADG_05845 [Paracoccidioides brasiliensis Pb18]|uniref:Methyltransferase domain-containing protein n=1 Tax=Paracoccidioides brasiliensis (strain Pb18) TaxID=502780 RepID=C1GF09_PARBD|nr:uncharacterized protein PADG_05845 [Paracoccidioides brasiliensis Pb18]EEH49766.1 hypothetical protein PADG_05845 [Paracoccidioides brasiliensis Pb18]
MAEDISLPNTKPLLKDIGSNMEVQEENMDAQTAKGEPMPQNDCYLSDQLNGTTIAVSTDPYTPHSHSLSSSKSLSEHIIEDILENGRRYCNETYFMPNDEAEQTRLTIVHQIYLIIYNGELTKTKLPPETARIFDIGTGTGDWALAMGELYPDAEILSVDISVFDSDTVSIAPPNVFFQIDNVECGEWGYHQPSHFIHIRGLSGGIADWPALYRKAFQNLEPGGSIEVTDVDFTSGLLNAHNAPANSYLSIFTAAIRSAADVAGYPCDLQHLRVSALAAAGFVQIRTHNIEVPIGTWREGDPRGNTLGKMVLIVLLEGLEAMSMRSLTKYVGWTPEGVRDLCDKVKMEIVMGGAEGAKGVVRVVTASKPNSDSV